jgi:hypothetical protein
MTEYYSGPPPSLGWWPCSDGLRWWNGEYWSQQCYKTDHPKTVEHFAVRRQWKLDKVVWTHRPSTWPKRSFT